MRKVSSFPETQIILNDLLNERDRKNNSVRDSRGFQIKNTAPATDLTDVVILEQLNAIIPQLAKASTPAPTSSSSGNFSLIVVDITLSANSSSITLPSLSNNSLILVIIRENAIGGWIQTWPSSFIGMAGFVQASYPLTYTAALFYTADTIKLQLIAAPVTGVR